MFQHLLQNTIASKGSSKFDKNNLFVFCLDVYIKKFSLRFTKNIFPDSSSEIILLSNRQEICFHEPV